MKLKNKDIVLGCLAKIETLQAHIKKYDSIITFIVSSSENRGLRFSEGDVRSELVRLELDEFRRLFLWSITLSDDDRDRIKALAYERFIKGTDVSMYLGNTSKWLVSDEEEFREMARKAFSPGYNTDG